MRKSGKLYKVGALKEETENKKKKGGTGREAGLE